MPLWVHSPALGHCILPLLHRLLWPLKRSEAFIVCSLANGLRGFDRLLPGTWAQRLGLCGRHHLLWPLRRSEAFIVYLLANGSEALMICSMAHGLRGLASAASSALVFEEFTGFHRLLSGQWAQRP